MNEIITPVINAVPVAIYDQDRSSFSREYVYSLTNSEYFHLAGFIDSVTELDRMMQSGTVRAVVVIPPDFSRKLHAQKAASIQIFVDGSFPSGAEIVDGYLTAINSQFNARLLSDYMARKGAVTPVVLPLTIEGRVWYNPSLESKNAIIPGLLVITLMFYPSLLAALVVVREKERGTIFNRLCSPVRRWEVVAGKAIPYIGVALVDYFLLLASYFMVWRGACS